MSIKHWLRYVLLQMNFQTNIVYNNQLWVYELKPKKSFTKIIIKVTLLCNLTGVFACIFEVADIRTYFSNTYTCKKL